MASGGGGGGGGGGGKISEAGNKEILDTFQQLKVSGAFDEFRKHVEEQLGVPAVSPPGLLFPGDQRHFAYSCRAVLELDGTLDKLKKDVAEIVDNELRLLQNDNQVKSTTRQTGKNACNYHRTWLIWHTSLPHA